MLRVCSGCGTRFAADLAVCPHCGLPFEEAEMPKIIAGVGASFPEGHAPGDGEEHVHPGTGVPMEGVEHPADGTFSTEIGNDASDGAPEPEQVTQDPAAPPVPPRTPPRRTPPPEPSGE